MRAIFYFLKVNKLNKNLMNSSLNLISGIGSRQYWFKCQNEENFHRGNYGSLNVNYVGITIFPKINRLEVINKNQLETKKNIFFDSHLLMYSSSDLIKDVKNEIYLLTTCKIEDKYYSNFLEQFTKAKNYMLKRYGFIKNYLFEANPGSDFRFINVSAWQSMEDFLAAFKNPEFKKIIKGGFDYSSQIIVARRIIKHR